ncbi:MAG: hypothetical protein KC776_09390 [Myxococcales bacterium]|nr:hypothetical protein [Myxococcales bacterium]MCB9581734.1 hypothetical protein [Polyangiaceae bacterium]
MNRTRIVIALGLFVAACGGGAAGGADAKNGGSLAGGEGGSGEGGGSENAEPAGPTLPSCDDGTCFQCGEGLCPKGFYCDEKATGGAACSWLPECAADASCGCVTKVLGSDCSCTEKSGGVFCE